MSSVSTDEDVLAVRRQGSDMKQKVRREAQKWAASTDVTTDRPAHKALRPSTQRIYRDALHS